MRKFYLENAAGDRIDLNGASRIHLTDPAGLGLTLTPAYADLKNGFFRAVSADSEPQSSFTATLTFPKPAPYPRWKTFVDWCSRSGHLYLVYRPYEDIEYYREVEISYFSKGELSRNGWLEIPASFFCLTPWYRKDPTTLEMLNSEGSAIRYSYRYTSQLIYGADSAAVLAGTVYPGGHLPGSVRLRYFGEILNPKIRLTGNVSGKTYGLCSVEGALVSGDTLELSTLYLDSHIRRIAADGTVTDLLDAVSLASEPFFHVPTDEPSTLSVEADAVFTGSAELEVFYYFRSV
ncbi:MAG: hypothetical protein IJV41_00735 [Oscillospiraceae bacterium]|nr:hypothetical protein [Oscillospiraceae bacterium]